MATSPTASTSGPVSSGARGSRPNDVAVSRNTPSATSAKFAVRPNGRYSYSLGGGVRYLDTLTR